MKIETSLLEDFLKKARMSEIESCLLQFDEDGLRIKTFSTANTHHVNALLPKDSFKEYQAVGNAGVDDLSNLIKVFKRLGKELEFSIEGNLLTAKGNKKELQFELVDEKFIDKARDLNEMSHDPKATIPAKQFNDFLNDTQMNKDTTIYIETVDGGVKLYNTGKYKFKYNIDSEGTTAGEKVKFGEPIINALGELKEGNLVFHLKSDYPILVDYKTEKYNMQFLVAPHVEQQ